MTVTYTGTNPRFKAIVKELSIGKFVATGRFRSKDAKNREKYPLTAALMDVMAAPYSKKLHMWHHKQCLKSLKVKCGCEGECQKSAVELDFIDIETEDM